MFGGVDVRVAVAAVATNPSLKTLSSLGSALLGTGGTGVVALPILKAAGVGFAVTLPFHWKVTLPLMAIGALVAVAAFKVFFKINTSEANFNTAVDVLLKKGYSPEEITFAIKSFNLDNGYDFEQFIGQQKEDEIEELTKNILAKFLPSQKT